MRVNTLLLTSLLIELITANNQAIQVAVNLLKHHDSRCINIIHINHEENHKFSIITDIPIVAIDLENVPLYGTSPSKAFCPDNILIVANHTAEDDLRTKFALSGSRYVIIGSQSLKDYPTFKDMARAVLLSFNNGEMSLYKRIDYTSKKGHMELIGKIKTGGPISDTKQDLFEPQTDFGGRELRAVAFQFYPYSQPDFESQSNHGGFEYRIAEAVSSSLNFKMRIYQPSSGERWGREDKPGSNRYDGMIGDLQRNLGDVGWGNMWVTEARLKAMDFTEFYALDSACFLVPQSDPYRGPRVLIFPLKKETWMGLLISLAAITTFYLVHSLIWNGSRYGFFSMVADGGMVVVNQTSPRTSAFHTNGLRIANGLFILSLLVLTLWYSGALISFLSVSVRPSPPDNFQQLSKEVEQNGWEVALCCTHIIQALKESSLDSFKLLYSKRIEFVRVGPGLVGVAEGRQVYVTTRNILEIFRRIHKNKAPIDKGHIMRDCFLPIKVALGLSYNSPYKEAFNIKMNQLRQGGIIDKMIKDGHDEVMGLLEDDSVGDMKSWRIEDAISLNEIQAIFQIVGVALTVAVGVFFAEVLTRKMQDAKRKRKKELRRWDNIIKPFVV